MALCKDLRANHMNLRTWCLMSRHSKNTSRTRMREKAGLGQSAEPSLSHLAFPPLVGVHSCLHLANTSGILHSMRRTKFMCEVGLCGPCVCASLCLCVCASVYFLYVWVCPPLCLSVPISGSMSLTLPVSASICPSFRLCLSPCVSVSPCFASQSLSQSSLWKRQIISSINSSHFLLWMDEILHHLEIMGNHCLLVFTRDSSLQGFLGGAKWILSIHRITSCRSLLAIRISCYQVIL